MAVVSSASAQAEAVSGFREQNFMKFLSIDVLAQCLTSLNLPAEYDFFVTNLLNF